MFAPRPVEAAKATFSNGCYVMLDLEQLSAWCGGTALDSVRSLRLVVAVAEECGHADDNAQHDHEEGQPSSRGIAV